MSSADIHFRKLLPNDMDCIQIVCDAVLCQILENAIMKFGSKNKKSLLLTHLLPNSQAWLYNDFNKWKLIVTAVLRNKISSKKNTFDFLSVSYSKVKSAETQVSSFVQGLSSYSIDLQPVALRRRRLQMAALHIFPHFSHTLVRSLPTTAAITTSATSLLKSIRKRSIINLEFNHWNSLPGTRRPYVSQSYATASLCREGFMSTAAVKPHAKVYCLLGRDTLWPNKMGATFQSNLQSQLSALTM